MNDQLKAVAARVAHRIGPEDVAAPRLIDLAVLVARADGVIDEAEKAALSAFVAELVGENLSQMVVDHLVSEAIGAIEKKNLLAQCEAIGKTLAKADVVTDGLELAIRIAMASNGLAEAEKDVIYAVAKAAGATPEQTALLIARVGRASLRPPPAG
jgi:tellurite resistance protein